MSLKPPLAVVVPMVTAGLVLTAPAVLADEHHCQSTSQATSGTGSSASSGGGHDGGHDCPPASSPAPAAVQPGTAATVPVAPGAVFPAPEPGANLSPAAGDVSRAPAPPEPGQTPAAAEPQARRTAAREDPGPPTWTIAVTLAVCLVLTILVAAGIRVRRQLVHGLEARWPSA